MVGVTDHRHATDRKEVLAVAECPLAAEDDDHMIIEMEAEGSEEAAENLLDTLREKFTECHCGRELDYMTMTQPTEVLD